MVNPSLAFCGSCVEEPERPCQSNSDCLMGCTFSSQPGAFGNDAVTSLSVSGKRGPYLPTLAGLACIGKTGDSLVDNSNGLPGPARVVRQQLNAFAYDE